MLRCMSSPLHMPSSMPRKGAPGSDVRSHGMHRHSEILESLASYRYMYVRTYRQNSRWRGWH